MPFGIVACTFSDNLSRNSCIQNKQNITWPLGDTNFIFSGWKYLLLVRFAHSWEILSALEDKIRIPARPCNILYLTFRNSNLRTTNLPITWIKKKINHVLLQWAIKINHEVIAISVNRQFSCKYPIFFREKNLFQTERYKCSNALSFPFKEWTLKFKMK